MQWNSGLIMVCVALALSGCVTQKVIEREVRVTEVVTKTVTPAPATTVTQTVTASPQATPAPDTPSVGWSDNEADDNWQVTQAPNNLPWSEFQMKANLNGASVQLDANAGYSKTLTPTYVALGAWGNIQAGQILQLCTNGNTRYDYTITLRHAPSSDVVHEFVFQTITEAC